MALASKHLLGISELSAAEIVHILDTAETFAPSRNARSRKSDLSGRTSSTLLRGFTRTRTSFELAGNVSPPTPSTSARHFELTKARRFWIPPATWSHVADFIVIRHPCWRAARARADLPRRRINAGDGSYDAPDTSPPRALTDPAHKVHRENLRSPHRRHLHSRCSGARTCTC